jgi:hypothetical protein
MKAWLAGAALVLGTSAQAADFINLNFELAQAPVLQQPFEFHLLDWATAAPGWGHSSGDATASVYYGTTHVGLPQWFLLTSAQSVPSLLLSGNYSLAFNSGNSSPFDPNSPFVHATLSQTGDVPAEALSLRLRATGPLAVFLGDVPIALQPLGGNLYAGDIAAFAGQALELRLVNLSNDHGHPVVVDDIEFSPLAAVPELPTLASLAAGLAGLLALSRRRRA